MTSNQSKACGFFLIIFLGAYFWIRSGAEQKQPPITIRAQKIELTDSHGRVRILLQVDQSDTPQILLLDEQEKERIQIQVNHDASSIMRLYDPKRRGNVMLSASDFSKSVSVSGGHRSTKQKTFWRNDWITTALSVYDNRQADLGIFATRLNGDVVTIQDYVRLGVGDNGGVHLRLDRAFNTTNLPNMELSIPPKGSAKLSISNVGNNSLIIPPNAKKSRQP